MKIQILALLATTLLSQAAYAHCPASFKEEKVCFMLEKNFLYIYDQKLEHNGPYKDLEKAQVLKLKSQKGEALTYKKIARGIFKIEAPENYKKVVVEISLNKKKTDVTVNHE